MLRKILCVGILLSAVVFGQGRGGGRGGGGGMGGGGMMMAPAASRMDRLTLMLDLNKDQKKEFKSMLDDTQKEANPIRDQIVKSRLAIGEALQAGKTGADLDGAIKANADLEAQMAAIEARAFAKMYKGVEKEQQGKIPAVFPMMKGIFSGKNWNNPE
jgi:hypothetical protein